MVLANGDVDLARSAGEAARQLLEAGRCVLVVVDIRTRCPGNTSRKRSITALDATTSPTETA